MYIAIEGIKGSGKSTLINSILNKGLGQFGHVEMFPITAPMCTCHSLERLIWDHGSKTTDDTVIERLFLDRAHWHHAMIEDKNGLILGDRSIATACVTRWNSWKDPLLTIERVREQYKGIIGVDVIIWLKTEVETALIRINQRSKLSIRGQDETRYGLSRAAEAYEELFKGKLYHKKIKRIQVVEINNRNNQEETTNEIHSILKFYSKS